MKEYGELPDKYLKRLSETKNVIQEIEMEEYQEQFDTEEAIRNRIVSDTKNSQIQKERFIKEIKSTLGGEIKRGPGELIYIKRPWHYKLRKFFKKLIKTI